MPPMFHVFPSIALLLLAWLVSNLLIRRMISVAVLDTPGHRSAHTQPIPKGGGVGVIGAFLLFLLPLRAVCGLPVLTLDLAGLCVATALLAVVSWLDDVYQWSPFIKLGAQILAALLAACSLLPAPSEGGLFMSALLLAASVIWLVFVTNAVNFMDGLNGLVSGVLCLAFLCLALPFWPGDSPDLRIASALLVFGLLAFLPLNFPHARIFLGDVGSQSGGLLIGAAALSLAFHQGSQSVPDFPAAELVVCLTAGLLYDVALTLVRRALAGEKILQAHRGHLYQVAYRTGVPKTTVTLIHWGFVIWGALAFALTGMVQDGQAGGSMFAPALPLLLVLIPQLGWTAFVVKRARRHPVGRW